MASESTGARRSAFFFHGRLDPPELANFNLQNIFLRDRRGGVFEIIGPGIAIWWPSRPRREIDDLAAMARDWFRTIASSYYIESTIALMPRVAGWVEALDVHVHEAVVGFADARFIQLDPPPEDHPESLRMRDAVDLARRLRGTGNLERATNELLAAAYDATPQGYLSAFRALECVRRLYEPRHDQRDQGWKRMWSDLGVVPGKDYEVLSQAAIAVRHGDLPLRPSARHPVNHARRRRDDLLAFVRDLIRRAIKRRLP
jgi:hypothetical protein